MTEYAKKVRTDEHLSLVLRYVEANTARRKVEEDKKLTLTGTHRGDMDNPSDVH